MRLQTSDGRSIMALQRRLLRGSDQGEMKGGPMRKKFTTPAGITISYTTYGAGSPLVLVHGGFSDDVSNWEFVKPMLEQRFTIYAIARRGRGETDATTGHSLEDEGSDIAALIDLIGEPVFLLGHSYGGQCSLSAAALRPERVRKLVLYEPPLPNLLTPELIGKFEMLASVGAWEDLAYSFFKDGLLVPVDVLDQVRASEVWAPIVADARATLGDLHALTRYDFQPERFRRLAFPVLLQVGTESPRHHFITDSLAAVLPQVRIEDLPGQAHEGMTTAPEMYAQAVERFLFTV
jgi:pimeloyl-ACP methyl ester carboxylesterase